MDVSVNAAMSVDGKLSSRRREQIAISGENDFARVDRLRAESDAVMVGVGTVLADNPSLIRHDKPHRRDRRGPDAPPPSRVVADSTCRTPTDAEILAGEPDTYILTSEKSPLDRRDTLRNAGAEIIVAGSERVDLPKAFERLETAGIEALLVEGGGELIFSLFDAGLVDELTVYVGNIAIGGRDAPTLVDGEGFVQSFPELTLSGIERIDSGALLRWDVN